MDKNALIRVSRARTRKAVFSSLIRTKIEQSPKLRSLFQRKGGGLEVLSALYLTILSRYPTDEEMKTAGAYYQAFTGNKGLALIDIVWALINSAELVYRH